jgi:signal transduction histidine kinase
MNLKIRLALLFSSLVTFILIVISSFIYISYEDLRKDAFFKRLEERAKTTARLLSDIRVSDQELLRSMDDNTIHELYDEKVLVFNHKNELIYSSLDNHSIVYDNNLLALIRDEKLIEYTENSNEVVGLIYYERGQENIVLVSAYDRYGLSKLNNLLYILIIAILIGLLLTAIAAYYYVRAVFKPLEVLNNKIRYISASNLQQKLDVKIGKDEISKLAENFNLMLERLAFSFESQKSFVQSASHELRTPLANLTSQLEKAQKKNLSIPEYKTLLHSLQEDLLRLTRIINSLLFLSRYDKLKLEADSKTIPVDRVLFRAIAEIKDYLPEASIDLQFSEFPEREDLLQIQGYEIILQTAFVNLLENACKYSDDNSAKLFIYPLANGGISVHIINSGPVMRQEDAEKIFQPFFRGENSINKRGFGLGLSIVKKIIEAHGGSIQYRVTDKGENNFVVSLPGKI